MEWSLKKKAKAVGKCVLWEKVVSNRLHLILKRECQDHIGYMISLEFRGKIQAGDL